MLGLSTKPCRTLPPRPQLTDAPHEYEPVALTAEVSAVAPGTAEPPAAVQAALAKPTKEPPTPPPHVVFAFCNVR